ncbi:MAG: acyl-CoA thioesterase [Thermoguttaceae bacterium]
MPIPIYEHNVVVTTSDIDENDHANNVSFIRWMQDAAVKHSAENGWCSQKYREFGFAWVARRHTIDYLLPALEGEKIVVKTWVASWKKVSSVRKYQFLRASDMVVLAAAETNWVFVSINTRKPTKIPPEVTESFIVMGEGEQVGR